ncbi:MAG: hypothetical protein ACTHLA_11920 [Asticcacaulis sp.]|uniref:hypothetical protein n=1 Tax=Asticcacaulis sp. TaxID=1872648 RepID=UPI003F7BAF43
MKGRWFVLTGFVVLLLTLGGLIGIALYAPTPAGASAPLSLPDLLRGWRGWVVLGVIVVALLLKLGGMALGVGRRVKRRDRIR